MKLSARVAVFELDGDEVRVALVKTGSQKPTVLQLERRVAQYDTEEEQFEARVAAVREVAGALKSQPNAYVLCADSRYGVVRTLSVPFRGSRKVAAAVQYELEPHLAFPIEDLVVDHSPIREHDGATEVLVVGMRKEMLSERLAVLEAAEVDVEGISIDAAGLAALWLCSGHAPKGLHGALHVRPDGSVLTFFNGTTLTMFRHLDVTTETLGENPSAVAREVSNSIRAFLASGKQETSLESLTVTGVDVDPAIRTALEDGLSLPVAFADLGDALRCAAGRKGKSENGGEDTRPWHAAIGAAVGATGGAVAYNFRKGELAHPQAWRSVALHGVFSVCLAFLLLVGYGVYCVIDHRHNVAEIERIGDEIWELYTETFPDSQNVQGGRPANDPGGLRAFAMMRQDHQDSDRIGRRFNPELLVRPTLLDVLNEISQVFDSEKVQITDLIVRPGTRSARQQVTIVGELKDSGAFTEQIQQLRESDLIEIDSEPTVSTRGAETTFTVLGML